MSAKPLPSPLLLAAGFVVAADVRVAAPLLPAIARGFHTSVGTAGLTVAVYAFAYAAGQVFYGRLGDRVGRVRVIRAALVLFAAGTGLSSIAPSLEVLLALRLLTGGLAAGVIPMSLAYFGDTIADYELRRRTIGLFLTVIVSGQVVGQALGGVLAGLLSWRAIFLVIGVVGVVLGAAMWCYPVARTVARCNETRSTFRQIFAANRALFLITVGETFCFLGAFAFAGSSLVLTHDASYPLVGSLLGCFALGSLTTSKGLTRVNSRLTDASRIALGAIAMALGLGLLATTPTAVWFGLAVFVLGMGMTLAHSTLQTRATDVSPQSRGVGVSLFAGLANVGAALGTFAAGALVDQFGFEALFVSAAVGISLVGIAAKLRLAPRALQPAKSGLVAARTNPVG